jgi:hypothetical protein
MFSLDAPRLPVCWTEVGSVNQVRRSKAGADEIPVERAVNGNWHDLIVALEQIRADAHKVHGKVTPKNEAKYPNSFLPRIFIGQLCLR